MITLDCDRMSHPQDFVFVIGAMKSGTTTLFQLLSQHPSIAPCRTKEPEFFSSDSSDAAWQEYLGLWDWDNETHRYALEASSGYTKAPWIEGVPERISSAPLRVARYIYVVRHPLDRMDSQVRHSLFEGWGHSLDDGMQQDAIDFSRYAFQLDRYSEAFKRGDLMIVLLDRLKAEPSTVMLEICDFLDIDSGFHFSALGDHANTGEMFAAHPWLALLIKSKFGRLISRALPPRSREKVRQAVGAIGRSSSSELRWRMNATERVEVGARLAGDLRRLRDVYGVDTEPVWPDMWV